MGGEAWTAHGGEHPVRYRELRCQRPVRHGFRLFYLRIREVGRAEHGHVLSVDDAERAFGVEIIHLAAVVRGREVAVRVSDIDALAFERHDLQRNALAQCVSARRRIGAGEPVEEVVEAAVLLDDHDDVLDDALVLYGRLLRQGDEARHHRCLGTARRDRGRKHERPHEAEPLKKCRRSIRVSHRPPVNAKQRRAVRTPRGLSLSLRVDPQQPMKTPLEIAENRR